MRVTPSFCFALEIQDNPTATNTYLLPYSIFFFQAQITDRVRHFLSEPVSVQVTVARNYSLIFPAITICNKVGVYLVSR